MSRDDLFSDFKKKRRSPQCRASHHDECDGVVYGKEWNERQHDCTCSCHGPLIENDRDRILSRKEA